MIVVVADSIPPAIRGRMKLWFLEPKPNVFVSGVKDSVAKDVVDYLYENCPLDANMIIIESTSKAPYYKVKSKGFSKSKIGIICGLPLIFDKISEG